MVFWSGTPGNYAGFSPVQTITCAGSHATTCYVAIEANGTLPDGQSVTMSSFITSEFRSTDVGRTWQQFSLPDHAWASTAFSCPTARMCAIGGAIDMTNFRRPTAVVLTTDDAGRSWMLHRLPASAGLVREVDCPTATECVAVAWVPTATWVTGMRWNSGATATFPWDIFVSHDAGTTWSEAQLPKAPKGDVYNELDGLACPSAERCILEGARTHVEAIPGKFTTNRGARVYQASGRTPEAYSLDLPNDTVAVHATVYTGEVSCVSARRCFLQARTNPKALYISIDAGRTWEKLAWHVPPGAARGTLLCVSATSCVVYGGKETATTNDGGRYWVVEPGLDIATVSCTTSGACVGLQWWRSQNFPTTGGRVETNSGR